MMTVTHQDQTQLIHFHAHLYRALMSRVRYGHEIDMNKTMHPCDKDYLFLIQETLKRLTQEEQRLLHNDFLMPSSKNWWMNYYSKGTYYRLRYLTMSRFLHCLHHEKMV